MKAAIIGGGPSGLFLSILLKQSQPEARITVYEQTVSCTHLTLPTIYSV